MTEGFPTFLRPPVVETVLAVGFAQPQGFNSVQMSRFWDHHLSQNFPEVSEQPRYEMPIEAPSRSIVCSSAGVQVRWPACAGRLWFSDGGARLVQLQTDWLAYNWRKVGTPEEASYERYPVGRARFAEVAQQLRAYLLDSDLGIFPTQCEVTYINHIELTQEDRPHGRLGGVLTTVAENARGFLPLPELTRYASSYLMQDHEQVVGRLHVSAEPGRASAQGEEIVVLTLTARGRPLSADLEGALAFCDLGREWIVKSFVELTTERMKTERWGLVVDNDRG